MHIELDVCNIMTISELHDLLASSLHLPDWYGRNPDALLDCLSELPSDTELVLRGMPTLERKLGPELTPILQAFVYASERKHGVKITFLQ